MRAAIVLSSFLALSVTAVVAQEDVIKERQALMKRNGDAMKVVVPMIRGEQPFDAAAALTALETLAKDAADLDADRLFPQGTETGGDTEASPKIWEDREGFKAAIEKFRTDSAAVVASPPQDVDALRAAVGVVGQNCQNCHETYRIEKDG